MSKYKMFIRNCEKECEQVIGSFSAFFQTNKFQIGILFFIMIFTYLFEMTNYYLSFDEEVNNLRTNNLIWITTGRWGIALLKYLNLGAIPVIATNNVILAVSFLFLSSVLFGYKIYQISGNKWAWFIFSSIYITFPYHGDWMIFGMSAFEGAVGLFLVMVTSICSFVFIAPKDTNDRAYRYLVLSILLLAFVISLNQSLIAVYIANISFLLFLSVYCPPPIICRFLGVSRNLFMK